MGLEGRRRLGLGFAAMRRRERSGKERRLRAGGRERDEGFRHILLTRYKIKSKFGANAGMDPLDPEWLEYRERLFLRFCAPSIERQTARDFEWVLLVNPATPERFLAPLGKHARLVHADSVRHAITQLDIQNDGRLLLTSRIDNDDAVLPEYIAMARAAALRYRQGPRWVVSFTHGVRVEVETMQACAIHRVRSPFLTCVETVPPFTSILSHQHHIIDQSMPLTAISTARPMWMQTLHGRNVSNQNGWDDLARSSIDAGHFAGFFPGLDGPNSPGMDARLSLTVMRDLKDKKAGKRKDRLSRRLRRKRWWK